MIEMAVVGLGPWGLCVFERVVNRTRQTGRPVRLHLIDPNSTGSSIYRPDQPDYLILNNPCGQISLGTAIPDDLSPAYGVGLHEWAVQRGYRWIGDECRITTRGIPIESSDYLPRRLMGEYLSWFFDALLAEAPDQLEIVPHRATATDIVRLAQGRERIILDNGVPLDVDHVVLTSGHTFNDEEPIDRAGLRPLRPYPVDYLKQLVTPASPVAIGGMGLVTFDILAAFTIGLGGSFCEGTRGQRYRASGKEPVIDLYSRSGIPPIAKSATGIDATGDYQPIVCTPDLLSAIRDGSGPSTDRRIDFRVDVLPLLVAEMCARYHTHCAFLRGGDDERTRVRDQLEASWTADRFDAAIRDLSRLDGQFDPESLFIDDSVARFETGDHYEHYVYAALASDVREAFAPGGSPTKAAQEVTRILRDDIRSVVEFGSLSLNSYLDFQSQIRSRITRLDAGPPPKRSQQLLALMDAGIVRARLGPDPTIAHRADNQKVVRSTRLDDPIEINVDTVVRGHLDMPSLDHSASPLLARLYRTGRLTQLSYQGTAVGSVAISDNFHPYDVEGRIQTQLSVLGVLTEGTRFFTHYVPSPKSRRRAVVDAQACVEMAIG
ncbi:MAG: FAD/NAD(P)-binding protein [Acidimicrobiales bacterium]|nr:FAD/NAD(P)-binding protein [Acidimicrobiales bacterium]